MSLDIKLTQLARSLLDKLKEEGRVNVILGDTGCCGYSNVYVTSEDLGASYRFLKEEGGIRYYCQHGFERALNDNILIDAIEVDVDDSFSLETKHGYRFIIKSD